MGISKEIANYLIREKEISDIDEQEVIIYGAEVLFSTISITIATLFIGYLMGLFHPVWIMLLASLIIRKTAGGAHCQNSTTCFFVTLISFNLMSFVAIKTIYFLSDYLLIIIFATIFISAFIIINKAPLETENKPISPNQRIYLKKLSICSLLLISIIIFILYIESFYLESYALCIVLIWQIFMMIKLGHSFIVVLDKLSKKEVKVE